MELALWTYEGPPHVGAIRIAASMRDVHLVLHAPQGLQSNLEAKLRIAIIEWGTKV